MYESTETKTPFTRIEIGHCTKCNTTVRRTVTGIRARRETWGLTGFKSSTRETEVRGDGAVFCKCQGGQRFLNMRALEGRTNPEIPCDARCTEAHGHKCECSCGGKNHGAAHG